MSPNMSRRHFYVETWWRDRPFLERIDAAAAAGFPAIELWPWRDQDIDAISAKTREHGMNDPANHDDVVSEIAAGGATAKR